MYPVISYHLYHIILYHIIWRKFMSYHIVYIVYIYILYQISPKSWFCLNSHVYIYIHISLHKYHIIMKFQLHHEAVHDSWVRQAHCFLAHTLWTNACLGVLAADNFSLLQVTVGERNGTKLDHIQYVPINTYVQFYITLLAYKPPTTCLRCLRVPSNSQQSYLNPHLQVRSDDLRGL